MRAQAEVLSARRTATPRRVFRTEWQRNSSVKSCVLDGARLPLRQARQARRAQNQAMRLACLDCEGVMNTCDASHYQDMTCRTDQPDPSTWRVFHLATLAWHCRDIATCERT